MAYRGLFVSLVDSVLRANDPEKQKLFFVTYPQYGTPYDLLNTLQESLKANEHKDDGPAFMNMVGAFLQRWVENCPDGMTSAPQPKLGVHSMTSADLTVIGRSPQTLRTTRGSERTCSASPARSSAPALRTISSSSTFACVHPCSPFQLLFAPGDHTGW